GADPQLARPSSSVLKTREFRTLSPKRQSAGRRSDPRIWGAAFRAAQAASLLRSGHRYRGARGRRGHTPVTVGAAVTSSRSSGLARLTGSVIAQKARSVLANGERVNVPRGDTRFPPPPPRDLGPKEAMDGWGYADTRFEVLKDGNVTLTGKRYELAGKKLPNLLPWMAKTLAA